MTSFKSVAFQVTSYSFNECKSEITFLSHCMKQWLLFGPPINYPGHLLHPIE